MVGWGFLLIFLCSTTIIIAQQGNDPPRPVPQQEPKNGKVQQDPPKPTESDLEKWLGFPIHGYLSTRYRGRWAGEARDEDLYQYLELNLGDPDRHTVTAHLFSRATEDIDGSKNNRGAYVFDSIADTFNSDFYARLYEGYVDLHRLGPTELVRLGRQYLYETPEIVNFDGASLRTKECHSFYQLQGGLYGGLPVHYRPFSSSHQGDALMGAYLQGKPWSGGRGRIDWIHIEDDNTSFGKEKNDLYGFGFWQSVTEYLHLYGFYSLLEERDRELLIRGTLLYPEYDFRLQVSSYRLMETQRNYSGEFDPFFLSTAFTYFPYWETRFLVYKGLGEHLGIEGGLDIREVNDNGDRGPLNHDFRRFHLTPSVTDWPLKGMRMSVTGEVWETPGTDDGDIRTFGADLSHQCSEKLKVSIGTAYALYQYDYYLNRERDSVRDYYIKLNYAWSKAVKLDVAYEFENDDFDDYQTLKLGVKYSF